MRTLVVAIVLLSNISSLLAQQSKKPLAAGTLTDNLYRNPELGLTYKVILGWVDRTGQIHSDPNSASNGQVLLAVFEHPPEVKGEDVNPAVIIAAESLTSFPGVKTAADYFDPLTEATTAQGFKVVNEPYETTVGARSLARSDFSKEIGKLTMYQSSLIMLSRGYAISFTFVGGSEDEVEQLVERLSFSVTGKKR